MSKKRLSEGTIRRFMKLAALKPIGDGVISEMANYKSDEDEPMEECVGDEPMEKMAHADEEPMEEGPDEEPMEEPDLEGEEPVDAPAEDAREELLRRVVQAVAAELAVDVEIEGGSEPEAELSAEEPELDLDPEPEPEAEEAPAEEPEEELMGDSILEDVTAALAEAGIEVVEEQTTDLNEEEVVEEQTTDLNEDLVKRVSARVAQRLLKEFS